VATIEQASSRQRYEEIDDEDYNRVTRILTEDFSLIKDKY
jgi:hypothetical protein